MSDIEYIDETTHVIIMEPSDEQERKRRSLTPKQRRERYRKLREGIRKIINP